MLNIFVPLVFKVIIIYFIPEIISIIMIIAVFLYTAIVKAIHKDTSYDLVERAKYNYKFIRPFTRALYYTRHIIKNYIKSKYQDKCNEASYPWYIQLGTKDLKPNEANSPFVNTIILNYIKTELEKIEMLFTISSINEPAYYNDKFYTHYSYDVDRYKNSNTPVDEIEKQVKLTVVDVVKVYLRLLNKQNQYNANDFIVINYDKNNNVLNIYVAQNPRGFGEILKYKHVEEKKVQNSFFKKSFQPFKQHDGKKVPMHWGYLLEEYYKGDEIGIYFPFSSHCHALITGSSGSGKSTMLLGSIANAMRSEPIEIHILDFKNSEDFHFLQEYPHYHVGEDCITGIRKYYHSFVESRCIGKAEIRHLLIIDEYSALIGYLQSQDRINKTKLAQEAQSMISEILAMGRSLGYGLWLAMQRPDANIFANGSRDNFMVYVALGNLSKEHKQMIFAGYNLPAERIYHAGEGLILAEGQGVQEVKYAMLDNLAEWKYHIHRLLMEGYLEDVADIGE